MVSFRLPLRTILHGEGSGEGRGEGGLQEFLACVGLPCDIVITHHRLA
jgi:hypothetical protein